MQGVPGLSAYEIYLKYYPGYEGDERAWHYDLIWNQLALTVTFNTGLGDPDVVIETMKGAVLSVEEPVRDGYLFLGWGIDGFELFDMESPITHNMTLIAVWLELNLFNVLSLSEEHTIFFKYLEDIGHGALLGAAWFNYTVFAPTNAAFYALAEEMEVELEDLFETLSLVDVMNHHLSSTVYLKQELIDAVDAGFPQIVMESMSMVTVATVIPPEGGLLVTVDDIVIVEADILATNGVIHVIERLLLPPSIE
ncbi:MAG: hypothetical protein EA374_02745 [Acholeplasmatales bacterium]|nr:MAG: hypothetical protein EA374_02745 [Acholeplasmatales bacterium]